ncbi:MAG: helix-turn-helix domain-containing protein [Caldisericia bacterium]|nr:helix-turn-helix domain-containing protein [Caldisericia bacterium]
MDKVGSILKKKREELDFKLAQVSEETKIRRKYLEAIENGTYNQIPDPVYTRSFLRIYAEYLGLDQVFILKRYLDEIAPEEIIDDSPMSVSDRLKSFFHTNAKWIAITFIVALVVGVSVWGISAWVFSQRNNTQQTPLNPTEDVREDTDPVTVVTTPSLEDETLPSLENSLGSIEDISYTTPFFDKLVVEIKADTTNQQSCWVKPVVDGVTKNAYTLRESIDKASYECEKSFRVHLGNAGIISLRLNGFSIERVGDEGEVVSLDILLEPDQYILMDTLKGGIVVDTKRFEHNNPQP